MNRTMNKELLFNKIMIILKTVKEDEREGERENGKE